MSRTVKNLISGLLIVILIATSGYTIYHVNQQPNNMMQDNMGTMPNMPENGMGTMPSMPENGMENMPNMDEIPEKPDGEMDQNSNGMQDMPNGEMNLNDPPEKPDGENDQNLDGLENMPNDQSNLSGMNMNDINDMNSQSNLLIYVLLGVQSLGISLIFMYLIMSKFNKKTFKETFSSMDKTVIYVLSIIIMTTVLTLVDMGIANILRTNLENNGMIQQGMDMNTNNITYTGVNEITTDTEITEGSYSSSKADENAILVSGNINASIENVEIEKTGDSDGGDNTSFYGMNSAILAKDGAQLTLDGLNITTDAQGANGVFSYGGSATTNNTSSDGTTITIRNSTITTNKDNSGGIMTTGGGTTNAYNLTITTNGVSSAAIRSDRGGGVVYVDEGTYTTTGSGSPSVYSTADITVKNATLISKVAEGIVVEGKNSVTIENCDLTDSNTKLNGLSTTYKNIFLYQSMSGDADTGNSSFYASNSKITTNNGDTFYITNTTSTITLLNNTIVNNDSNGNFLRAQADSWGNEGSNGGDVELVLMNQKVTGNIVIDEVSTLDMTMEDNSYYEGAINTDNSAKSLSLKLSSSSNIKLTGDTYVTSFENEDESNSNIDFNGYTLYVNGKAIN